MNSGPIVPAAPTQPEMVRQMHNEQSFSLTGLDRRTRARLGVIAQDMGRTPEALAAAILSEWAWTIIEGLAQPPAFAPADKRGDFINFGVIEPPEKRQI